MQILSQKPKMASRIYKSLMRFTVEDGGKQNATRVLTLLAGMGVEMALVFGEAPDDAACAMLESLSRHLGTAPNAARMGEDALPPRTFIDREIEKGRVIARDAFEEWDDCSFEFNKFFIEICHDIFVTWEQEGFERSEMLRLFSEVLYRGLAYEFAAQELCDLLIDHKASVFKWDLNTCISALASVAGAKRAAYTDSWLSGDMRNVADDLDHIIYTMTQEAVRLGVPAGSNWRFGLAANDVPLSAPMDLVSEFEPVCDSFFKAMKLMDRPDQAVAAAKAAGRLLAVTSGGDLPEIEPAITKPLAVSAMTDTYKYICMDKMESLYS